MASTTSYRVFAASAVALCMLSASSVTMAQGADEVIVLTDVEIETLPTEYQSGPIQQSVEEVSRSADGVETIVRTRRIDSAAIAPQAYYPRQSGDGYARPQYTPVDYAPQATVFEREQWVEECNRRTSGRSEDDKGGIIGGLLGAITGGLIGNRIADGDRLLGTVIGAGTGGLGGFLLGNLIGGGKKEDAYDCEAALDSYLSQYGTAPLRVANRSIPAQEPVYGYPARAPQPGYGYAPNYGYGYAPPQQIVYVPVRYEQPQRVIIRETVREETYEVPGATRIIENPRPVPVSPAPSPKMIKQ